jgi:predicted DNA-binding ArsR family transcriptional regulator
MFKYLHSRVGTNLNEKETFETGTVTVPGLAVISLNKIVNIIDITVNTDGSKMCDYIDDTKKINKTSLTSFTPLSIQLNQQVRFGEPIRNDENLLEIYEIKD